MKTRRELFRQCVEYDRAWFLLLAAVLFLTICVYDALPARVPLLWESAHTTAEFGTSRLVLATFLPALAVVTYIMGLVLGSTDPGRADSDDLPRNLHAFRLATPLFLLGIQVGVLALWLGATLSLAQAVYLGTGLLFVILGKRLEASAPEHPLSARAPYPIKDRSRWRPAEQFAAHVWVLGGWSLMLTLVVPASLQVMYFVAVTGMLVLLPVFYARNHADST